jgi:succinyl-CoA synthetase beta subunit
MASAAGGMEIEEVAAKILTQSSRSTSSPASDCEAFQARQIAFRLGLEARYITGA